MENQKIRNLIPLTMVPAYQTIPILVVVCVNAVLNAFVIGALLYIMGEKIGKKTWEFASLALIGTIAAQFLAFAGMTGVILIFIAYAFLARAIMGMEPKTAIAVGLIMAALAFVGMQPNIGQPIAQGVTKAASELLA